VLANRPLRVLALVADGFSGHGGIAEYNRNFLGSLAACDTIGEVLVLPRLNATPLDPVPFGVAQRPAVKGRIGYSLAALRTILSRRIDMVFCGQLKMVVLAAALAKLARAPLWVQVHGIEAWEELSGLHRRCIETATLVTSVSRYTRRRLLGWVDVDPMRVKVLPATVDPRFQPGPKSESLLQRHSAVGKKILLTVSRLASSERYKGHDRVIRVLPSLLTRYSDALYLVVGDGDDRPRLEKLAADLGLTEKVKFVGVVTSEELPEYFRLADVFVMPSTAEGFGIVFLEAMASGIPVIGGNRDGSLDALADGVLGSPIDPENKEDLVSAICAALCNPSKATCAKRFNVRPFTEHVQALVDSGIASASISGWNSSKSNACFSYPTS
jgi:phosphatidyl-myo-inositol dimannoside synthase